ncbi:glucose-6-phosphate dehydrogenase [Gracilinema caldarium]|uniref:glucose-6-phosphate dehydrogenase n=1 Tax=Gracilinema caldarium TaxID=215591 RepID=UPI0026F21C34|nr:glucose-6-phosphate dehydrogenase [Gracilinema caldarium]
MEQNIFAAGLPVRRRPRPFTLLVFGASGDLAHRKLYPAFFSLFREGAVDDWYLVGFGRRPWSDSDFRSEIEKALSDFKITEDEARCFFSRCLYVQGDIDDIQAYHRIASIVEKDRDLISYLAVPPEQYKPIIDNLYKAGLSKRSPLESRVVVEKPFGRSGKEAAELNDFITERYEEDSIFRIDHYLGKETVQNIAVFRFGNGIFEPIWNNNYIHHVEITVAETVGVEKRAAYYEQSGALRDMVQNHLLQLLALVAMEPPTSFTSDTVRDEKVKVLRALRPLSELDILSNTLRGQYRAGLIDGQAVPGYLEESGVDPQSKTETYAALMAHVDSWRWFGVPFILRTGKRLSRRVSEIAVHFKKPAMNLFPQAFGGANQLVFRIQPDEGLTLYLNTKIPGLTDRSRVVSMDFLYGTGFGRPSPEAYERLLLDALIGDSTLYTRRDEVEASWAFIDPIRRAWDAQALPLHLYEAGSSGPLAAQGLAERIGDHWRRL